MRKLFASDFVSNKKYKIAACLSFIVLAAFSCPFAAAETDASKSALDRIIAKREIRCGYNVYSPYLRKDPNTGELSGIFYDLMAEIGKNANLKIVWAEEVGRGDIFSGLDSNRYDVWCSGIWPDATRGLVGGFTHPAFFSVVTAWVRQDDARFQTLADLVKYEAKVTAVDGAMEDIIARNDYPTLPRTTLPQLTPFDTNFQNIITKKADVTFAEPASVAEFLNRNPGTMRSLGESQALRVFGNTLATRLGDDKTIGFLNAAVDEIVYSGAVDRILKKYEPVKGAFLRVARPFAPVE